MALSFVTAKIDNIQNLSCFDFKISINGNESKLNHKSDDRIDKYLKYILFLIFHYLIFLIFSDKKAQSKPYKAAYECIYGMVPIGTSKDN